MRVLTFSNTGEIHNSIGLHSVSSPDTFAVRFAYALTRGCRTPPYQRSAYAHHRLARMCPARRWLQYEGSTTRCRHDTGGSRTRRTWSSDPREPGRNVELSRDGNGQ